MVFIWSANNNQKIGNSLCIYWDMPSGSVDIYAMSSSKFLRIPAQKCETKKFNVFRRTRKYRENENSFSRPICSIYILQ